MKNFKSKYRQNVDEILESKSNLTADELRTLKAIAVHLDDETTLPPPDVLRLYDSILIGHVQIWRLCERAPSAILIRALLPPEFAEDVVGNLEHYFQSVWLKRHGTKAARAIFYCQIFRLILSHYWNALRCILELYLKTKK
jgi:hypothetical protein